MGPLSAHLPASAGPPDSLPRRVPARVAMVPELELGLKLETQKAPASVLAERTPLAVEEEEAAPVAAAGLAAVQAETTAALVLAATGISQGQASSLSTSERHPTTATFTAFFAAWPWSSFFLSGRC